MSEKVMSMAEVSKLQQKEAVTLAKQQDGIAQRAFIVIAKVLAHLESISKDGDEKAATILVKGGVRKCTIDNARHASKVWKLVTTGHLSEEAFDSMSRMDFVLFEQHVRPMGMDAVKEVAQAKNPAKAIEKFVPAEKQKGANKKLAKVENPSTTPEGTPAPAPEAVEIEETEAPAANVTQLVAPEAVAVLPTESDLIGLAAHLESGVKARLAAGEDVSHVYTILLEIVSEMSESVTPIAIAA